VYCPDRPYLFAQICSFFEKLNYNIMEARIHTTQHGYALDSFLIMDASKSDTEYRDVMNYIEHELAQQLTRVELPMLSKVGRISRQLKHFPITPEAQIKRDEKGRYVLSIVAGDRPGLLARIAHVLAQYHIELLNAKINTLGWRAEDTFWISGKSLEHSETVKDLCDTLTQQLG
jgi:[protein-PII] uridylyltransferase